MIVFCLRVLMKHTVSLWPVKQSDKVGLVKEIDWL